MSTGISAFGINTPIFYLAYHAEEEGTKYFSYYTIHTRLFSPRQSLYDDYEATDKNTY